MGTTANLGIVYPDASTVPSRATYVENPLKSVDTKVVEYLRKRVKGGSATATIAIGQASSPATSVTFTTPFASAPACGATARSSFGYTATLASVSTTGMTVVVHRPAGASTAAAATVTFDWDANDLGNA